ncbi:MAG: aminotransferase class V-fold PLP-dependent enzyme [Proteobacteria bacterium]|nr:aminotransferase class V-fold PLP-dependent enzyme [Pseudomonadota bacterium]
MIHLNHGSFGAVPKSVAAEQDRWRALIERDATGFFKDVLPDELRRQAGSVASRFGGKANDWVFVENATQAINGVLSSFPLRQGDEIVTTSHAYGAVMKALLHWSTRRDAKLVVADLPFFLESDQQVIEIVRKTFTARTKLLVVDHITSSTAAIFPVKEIVAQARAAGIAVLVDGAHVPGHLPLGVEEIGADWYTGNAHKWLFAPKGCGLLWTSPARQAVTSPAVLSWGSDQGYTAAFDWIGTRDVTPWLCFEAAAAAHDGFGGADLMVRNRRLANDACLYLIENTNRKPSSGMSQRGAMAAIAIAPAPTDADAPAQLRRRLARDYGIVAPLTAFADRLWLRISVQLYNEWSDYEALRAALDAVIGG